MIYTLNLENLIVYFGGNILPFPNKEYKMIYFTGRDKNDEF